MSDHHVVDINGKQYKLTAETYGALGSSGPLSCVSVANSALSVDPWTGCRWQCAYCHVQGSARDLSDSTSLPRDPAPRTDASIQDIVDALVAHPYFVPDHTVVSIGTASTEPLAPGKVGYSTFAIMKALSASGLANPIWIVTKSGVSYRYLDDLERAVARGQRVVLSLSWAGNPSRVEPIQNNRFKHVRELARLGVKTNWFFRPLAPSWLAESGLSVERAVEIAAEMTDGVLDSVVPGMLRWSEGIELAMTQTRGVDFPHDKPKPMEKSSDQFEVIPAVVSAVARTMPGTPTYLRSACALAHALREPCRSAIDVTSPRDCNRSSCPADQRQKCAGGAVHTEPEAVVARLRDMGLPIDHEALRVDSYGVGSIDIDKIAHMNGLPYATAQTILNNLNS